MKGPQHYAEAERLLEVAESTDWTTTVEAYRDPAIAAAQVHATLALAAATIDAATQNVTHSDASGYSATQTDVANGVEWAQVQS